MALVVKDRVQETTTTTGTGTITLAGAVSGFQSFSAIGDGNTTYYSISGGSEWELGIGTYTASGTTLSRDVVLSSSNSGSLVPFSAGTKTVFCTYPTERVVIADGSSIFAANSAILPVSAGGTGANTLTAEAVIVGNTTSSVKFVSPGTSSNVLTSNGTAWVSQAPPASNNASALTTGTVGVNVGGTGATTLDANNVILGNGTSAVQFVAPGTSSNVLTSNGTTWVSQAASVPSSNNAVGTYALIRFTNNTIGVPGSDHVAGTLLAFSNCTGSTVGNGGNPYYASGTWRTMGDVPSSGTTNTKTTVMLRIA